MSSKTYELQSLEWDTNYFGVSSARVNLNGILEELDKEEIIAFCKDYDFVTILNSNNIKENNHWIGNKTPAFLADMNIQFSKNLVERLDYNDDDTTYVVNCLSRNEQIVNIAKKSFNYSRFFNDPSLTQKKASEIYLYWTECAFNQQDKYFVVSEKEGKIAGYLLFSLTSEKSSVIELIAVDEKYQGKNVGKSLIKKMELFLINKRIEKIKVGTQVNNISAVKFYTAMGFKYKCCGSVYHLWRK